MSLHIQGVYSPRRLPSYMYKSCILTGIYTVNIKYTKKYYTHSKFDYMYYYGVSAIEINNNSNLGNVNTNDTYGYTDWPPKNFE